MKPMPLEVLNKKSTNTVIELLGIHFTSIGEDIIEAEMPVDRRTHQVFGILHGGASVVLAETIGSVGGTLCVDAEHFRCVGIEINANHIGAISSGMVIGRGQAVHIGKKTQVWDIRISEKGTDRLICVSRLTLAVIPK